MAEQPTELPLQTVVRFHQRRAEDYGDWRTTRSRRPGGIGDRRDSSLASAGQPSLTTANERRQRQRELAYGFAEGRGTTYSSFVPIEKSGKDVKRHSIIIANGEETSDELAMHAGEIRMAGETVRWIDLPVAKVGCPDAFDRAPSFNSAAKRSAWFDQQCAAIRAGCRRYHGRAHRHFIRRVIRRRRTIRGELIALRDSFVKLVTKDETDHVIQHLAKNFGHIYAAGIQAVRLAPFLGPRTWCSTAFAAAIVMPGAKSSPRQTSCVARCAGCAFVPRIGPSF